MAMSRFDIRGMMLVVWLALVPGDVLADSFSSLSTTPGGTVTLSGQALPNSPMSAYFSCVGGCGQTHLGVATADARGRYNLTFRVPSNAKSGGAYVQIGCDKCGNGWRKVAGLNVVAGQAAPPPTLENVDRNIIASYQAAFGRGPDNVELTGWRDQIRGNSRLNDPARLFALHLNYLNTEVSFQVQTAQRALQTAFQSELRASDGLRRQLADPRSPLMRRAIADLLAQQGGGGYRGLVSYLGQPKVRAAYLGEGSSSAGSAGATSILRNMSGTWPIGTMDKSNNFKTQTGCLTIDGNQVSIRHAGRTLQGQLVAQSGCGEGDYYCNAAVWANGRQDARLSYFLPKGNVDRLDVLIQTNDAYYNTGEVGARAKGANNTRCDVPRNVVQPPAPPSPPTSITIGCSKKVNCDAFIGTWSTRAGAMGDDTRGAYSRFVLDVMADGSCTMTTFGTGGGTVGGSRRSGTWTSTDGQKITIFNCGANGSGSIIGGRLVTQD